VISAGANVTALQRMVERAPASMTLDIYSDLFDDDQDSVAVSENVRAPSSHVGK